MVSDLAAVPGRVDLVVDCAGHCGLAAHGPAALARGIDVISISSGALIDPGLWDVLADAAQAGGGRLRLLHGALGGIDALCAASVGGIDRLRYTARKPPNAWRGTVAEDGCCLAELTRPQRIFHGTARVAAGQYPKNANVAATIALASVGLDALLVDLVADPTITCNVHEVQAEGAFGRMSVTLEGTPLAQNAKTSAMAAMSLVAEIRRRRAPIAL